MDHIATAYFKYRPAAHHGPSCSRAGTDTWEVTQFRYENHDGETKEFTIRFVCSECTVVKFVKFHDEPSVENTRTDLTGYGAAPERVSGFWLHPGPRYSFQYESGPLAFYLTRSKNRPQSTDDVAGVVGWSVGPRGGIRWSAGTGCTDYGSVKVAAEQKFTSRRAAVNWVAEQIKGNP